MRSRIIGLSNLEDEVAGDYSSLTIPFRIGQSVSMCAPLQSEAPPGREVMAKHLWERFLIALNWQGRI
jgi:hypothetical protein